MYDNFYLIFVNNPQNIYSMSHKVFQFKVFFPIFSKSKNFCKLPIDYLDRFDEETTCTTILITQVRNVVEKKTAATYLEVVIIECDVIVVPECITFHFQSIYN